MASAGAPAPDTASAAAPVPDAASAVATVPDAASAVATVPDAASAPPAEDTKPEPVSDAVLAFLRNDRTLLVYA